MNNVTNEVKRGNYNELAKAEIAKMVSLAGQPPRTIFLLDVVVLADLAGRGMHSRQTEPIVDSSLFKEEI